MNVVAALLVVTASGLGQSDESSELAWSVDYAQAFAAAKSSRKPLLVVIEDSTKQGNQFDEDKLASEPTQVQLMSQFELCKIDASSKKGKQVAKAWGATQFPYTAITDRTNSVVVYRKGGQMSRNEWIAALVESKDRVYVRKPVAASVTQPSAPANANQNLNWNYTSPTSYRSVPCFT